MRGSKTKQYCICHKMSSVLYKNTALWLTIQYSCINQSAVNKSIVILSHTHIHVFLSLHTCFLLHWMVTVYHYMINDNIVSYATYHYVACVHHCVAYIHHYAVINVLHLIFLGVNRELFTITSIWLHTFHFGSNTTANPPYTGYAVNQSKHCLLVMCE